MGAGMSEIEKLQAMLAGYREMQAIHLREQQEMNERLRSLLALHGGPKVATVLHDLSGPIVAGGFGGE